MILHFKLMMFSFGEVDFPLIHSMLQCIWIFPDAFRLFLPVVVRACMLMAHFRKNFPSRPGFSLHFSGCSRAIHYPCYFVLFVYFIFFNKKKCKLMCMLLYFVQIQCQQKIIIILIHNNFLSEIIYRLLIFYKTMSHIKQNCILHTIIYFPSLNKRKKKQTSKIYKSV